MLIPCAAQILPGKAAHGTLETHQKELFSIYDRFGLISDLVASDKRLISALQALRDRMLPKRAWRMLATQTNL
jgi:hypothetical protein